MAANSVQKYGLHFGLWIFMFLFVFDYHWYDGQWLEAILYTTLEVIGYMVIFYSNTWIFDTYWLKNVSISVGLSLCFMFGYSFLIIWSGFDYHFYDASSIRNLYSLLLNAGLFTALAYLFKYVELSFYTQQKNLQLEAMNKEMQLRSLKARINPHFLFNTLNNLNALLVNKDERLPTFISKLSSVLRYSLDEGSKAEIPLIKELGYIKNYIQLIEIQEPATDDIDFYEEGELDTLRIIPFILTTLVENAIKHSDIQVNTAGFLHIEVSATDKLEFKISNSFDPSNLNESTSKGGIGIENIKRQLELYYTHDFSLDSIIQKSTYTTILSISINKLCLFKKMKNKETTTNEIT